MSWGTYGLEAYTATQSTVRWPACAGWARATGPTQGSRVAPLGRLAIGEVQLIRRCLRALDLLSGVAAYGWINPYRAFGREMRRRVRRSRRQRRHGQGR